MISKGHDKLPLSRFFDFFLDKSHQEIQFYFVILESTLITIYLQDIKSKWGEVKTLVPQRDQTLEDELRKQQNNEALRRQFADKSNQVGPWIERQMDAVAAIGMGMQVCVELFMTPYGSHKNNCRTFIRKNLWSNSFQKKFEELDSELKTKTP